MFVTELMIQYSDDGVDWENIVPTKYQIPFNSKNLTVFKGMTYASQTKNISFESMIGEYPYFVIKSN